MVGLPNTFHLARKNNGQPAFVLPESHILAISCLAGTLPPGVVRQGLLLYGRGYRGSLFYLALFPFSLIWIVLADDACPHQANWLRLLWSRTGGSPGQPD